ncbi:MAG: hypothetical protein M1826_003269 [Phylliscum demangeonii]|nr:MAG: hypothetical protein M1826_003269 [Phylliscum demangeonii]
MPTAPTVAPSSATTAPDAKDVARTSVLPSSAPAKPAKPRPEDTLRPRDALLKGREGSRRRRRWENDRLLNNPHMQPPLPSDWAVQPTYPRYGTVPYYLAPLWDEMKARSPTLSCPSAAATMKNARRHEKPSPASEHHPRAPRELREKLKKAKTARGLLQHLELEIRHFVQSWHEKQRSQREYDPPSPSRTNERAESDDEEIVFIGRNGQMDDIPPDSPSWCGSEYGDEFGVGPERDRLIFDSLADDRGAAFGRWLVHSIATYYGLRTWSVTVGDPARREAYVGIDENVAMEGPPIALPRPLWGTV